MGVGAHSTYLFYRYWYCCEDSLAELITEGAVFCLIWREAGFIGCLLRNASLKPINIRIPMIRGSVTSTFTQTIQRGQIHITTIPIGYMKISNSTVMSAFVPSEIPDFWGM